MQFSSIFAKKMIKIISSFSIFICLYLFVIFSLTSFNNSTNAQAAGAFYGSCGTACMANQNYYGRPYNYNNVYYPYQMLQYHSLYGPTPYYFQPYGPSPYQPADCIQCMQRYQQFTAPMNFPGNNMPITFNGELIPLLVEMND